MRGLSYKIATVWGIPIKVHISLVVVVLLFVLQFRLPTGVFLAVGLFTSIALHELGHSFVAIRKGCRVREISLMCIGGAAQMMQIPRKPLDEFLMAVAGPAVSLALAGLLWMTGGRLPLPHVRGYPVNAVQFLGLANVTLLVFNLLPAFPMDGGRVFRAMLTPKLGRLRATLVAARLGKILAVLFGIYAFRVEQWFLVAIAFFIYIAAGNEYRMVRMQETADAGGFHAWPPYGDSWSGNDNGDSVIIGPPPYKDGPDTETDIHPSDDDPPFRRLFR